MRWFSVTLAERAGFEPAVPCSTHAFQACSIDHSDTSPRWVLTRRGAVKGLENPVKPLMGLQIYGKERNRRAVGFWEN